MFRCSRFVLQSFAEIEVKFRCDTALLARFSKLHSGQRTSFVDEYFDRVGLTPTLTGHDMWLRKRDGKWQLKVPASQFVGQRFVPPATDADNSVRSDTAGACAATNNVWRYNEFESPVEIAGVLRALLRKPAARGAHSADESRWLHDTLEELGVRSLGAFETVRHSFAPEPRFRVDIDQCAALDYMLGEVEVVRDDGDDAAATDAALLQFCARHGLDVSGAAPPGKIIVHLKRHHPELYKQASRAAAAEHR